MYINLWQQVTESLNLELKKFRDKKTFLNSEINGQTTHKKTKSK